MATQHLYAKEIISLKKKLNISLREARDRVEEAKRRETESRSKALSEEKGECSGHHIPEHENTCPYCGYGY